MLCRCNKASCRTVQTTKPETYCPHPLLSTCGVIFRCVQRSSNTISVSAVIQYVSKSLPKHKFHQSTSGTNPKTTVKRTDTRDHTRTLKEKTEKQQYSQMFFNSQRFPQSVFVKLFSENHTPVISQVSASNEAFCDCGTLSGASKNVCVHTLQVPVVGDQCIVIFAPVTRAG